MIEIPLILLLYHVTLVSPSNRETVGLSGSQVVLTCQVNRSKCGDYHSIKWYKEGARVAVFSPANNWWRVELNLENRAAVTVDDDMANLTFSMADSGDEGDYKCEVTFLDISPDCPVVQVTRLVAMARPNHVIITLLDGSLQTEVTGDLIGPFIEGSELRLICEAIGGKPDPHIFWFIDDKLVSDERSSFVFEPEL